MNIIENCKYCSFLRVIKDFFSIERDWSFLATVLIASSVSAAVMTLTILAGLGLL